jgi:hypothetical protein
LLGALNRNQEKDIKMSQQVFPIQKDQDAAPGTMQSHAIIVFHTTQGLFKMEIKPGKKEET